MLEADDIASTHTVLQTLEPLLSEPLTSTCAGSDTLHHRRNAASWQVKRITTGVRLKASHCWEAHGVTALGENVGNMFATTALAASQLSPFLTGVPYPKLPEVLRVRLWLHHPT